MAGPQRINWLEWMPQRLKISSKIQGIVPFRPNPVQEKLYMVMEAQRDAGLPTRVIVLKSRQHGISTGFEAYCFTDVFNRAGRRAFVAAHDNEASQVLFTMNKLFNTYLPREEQREMVGDSKRELRWASPRDSSFLVQTAGKKSLGRSDHFHLLHCSEVAFWPDAASSLLSVLQCVPDEPDTAVLIESTANGVGGEFYDRWQQAVQDYRASNGALDGYVPLFFSWLEDPTNVMPVPKGYDWGALTEDEEYLKVACKATDEQLYWRRWALVNKCGGDEEKLKQEYPTTPEEAFRHSGRPAIPSIIRARHRSTAKPEAERCRFHWDPGQPCGVRPEFGMFTENCWLIWNRPEEGHDYIVAGDIFTGQLCSPSNANSEPDWNASVVLNRRELRTDAARMDRQMPDIFGEEMVKCAWWYNEAWASPEINNAGYAALASFVRYGYNRLYQRQPVQDSVRVDDAPFLGWKTTMGNRDPLIDDYIAACRADWSTTGGQHEADYENKLTILWEEIVRQEDTFERDKRGKRQHRAGTFDDALFALMIAWALHVRCPRGALPTAPPIRRARVVADMNRPGAVDWGMQEVAISSRQTETE